MIDVVEHVRGGLVDRRDARTRRRVGCRTRMHRARFETVADRAAVRIIQPRLARLFVRRFGCSVSDDAGVHAAPGQFAAETAEFDLRAAVHDDVQPRGLGLGRRGIVAYAKLHPDHLGADRDGIIDDGANRLRRSEYVHHIDRVGNVAQAGVNPLPQQVLPRGAGVHGDDPVALALQIFHHEVAGPVPVGRRAHHRNGADRRQNTAQPGVGVGDGVKCGHRGRSFPPDAVS